MRLQEGDWYVCIGPGLVYCAMVVLHHLLSFARCYCSIFCSIVSCSSVINCVELSLLKPLLLAEAVHRETRILLRHMHTSLDLVSHAGSDHCTMKSRVENRK